MGGRAAVVAMVVALAVAAGLGLSAVLVRSSSPATTGPPIPEDRPGLVFTVAAERQSVSLGEPIFLSAVVRNQGLGTIVLTFRTTCQATFTVSADDSTVVYDRSLHEACYPDETRVPLAPGDTFRVPFVWSQVRDDGLLVPAGHEYRIHVVLLSQPGIWGGCFCLSAEADVLVGVGRPLTRAVFRVEFDRGAYAPGNVANVTLILSNNGTTTLYVDSPDGCDIGFMAVGPRNVVFYSGHSEACLMVVSSFSLTPGESRSVVRRWALTSDSGTLLPPGDYEAWPVFVHAGILPSCEVETVPTAFQMSG